ncbi:Rnase H [Staphylococcus phage Alsa_1]|nr:Rnase H [Staphylococcus phage Alsa_1]
MKHVNAYVDGSIMVKYHKYGSGVVLVDSNNNLIEKFGKSYDNGFYKYRNVAGECIASLLAIHRAIELGYDSVTIYYDYLGICFWAIGKWKANNELTKWYKKTYNYYREFIAVEFVKVKAHSNDKYNDLADYMAKLSIENGVRKEWKN